jgi:hypothetical protein
MIGIPGQSYAILARDIDLFRAMDLDMIGVGPYIANPDAPLGCGGIETPELAPRASRCAGRAWCRTRWSR